MKRYLYIFLFCLGACATFAQKKLAQPEPFNYLAKPDSIIRKTSEGIVYITTDTTSNVYRWIIPNPNSKDVQNIYSDFLEHIKNTYSLKINKYNIQNFPRSWNSVYEYNGKFYLYAPSDWMSNSGYFIADSVIYITSSDPADLYVLTNVQLKDEHAATFEIVNYAGEKKTINIEIFNKVYGIYTWKMFDKDNKLESKFLMQNSDFSKKLPMIVNDCGGKKCFLEFDFN